MVLYIHPLTFVEVTEKLSLHTKTRSANPNLDVNLSSKFFCFSQQSRKQSRLSTSNLTHNGHQRTTVDVQVDTTTQKLWLTFNSQVVWSVAIITFTFLIHLLIIYNIQVNFFLSFICNCLSYFTTTKITFTSILCPHFTHMIFII